MVINIMLHVNCIVVISGLSPTENYYSLFLNYLGNGPRHENLSLMFATW